MLGIFGSVYLTEILTALGVILGFMWFWIKYNLTYWKRYNMPYIKPHPLFGNIKEIITMSSNPAEHFQKLYNDNIAINQPAIGIYLFNRPALLLRDPELMKTILIKDFNQFSNRFAFPDPHSDPLGTLSLVFAKNPLWKKLRYSKISQVFTVGKIKNMFPLMKEVGQQLDQYLCSQAVNPRTGAIVQEVKEICALYTTDLIASVAYGVVANSLKNSKGEFRTNGRHIFNFTRFRTFEINSVFFFPILARLLGFKIFSKKTTNFIRNTISYVMENREQSGIIRNDVIDFLLKFKRSAEIEKKNGKKDTVIEGDALVSMGGIFFAAGFENTSSTISFTLYELSKRLDLQERLRKEIRLYLRANNGDITFDMVDKMCFLDQVLHEILRLYPSQPFLDRECTLEKGTRNYSLQPFFEFNVPDGMPIIIPVYALQRDSKYFSNPNEFNPDRFGPSNRYNLPSFGYIPFGMGPHNCIGQRLGLAQSKLGIISFLRNHYVTPCEKSCPTMVLDRSLVLQSVGGIYLNVIRDPLF